MRGSPPIASTATTSRRCARWRGCIAPRRRGTSCRQTIRRIIDVGQLSGRDRRARDDRAVRTARSARGRRARPRRRGGRCVAPRRSRSIRRTSARSRRSRVCSRARAGGRRRSTCSRSARSSLDDEAQRRETLLQAAATWEEKVEDLTRAAQVYERVRAPRPGERRRRRERLEAIYRQQYKWTELVEILLERSELRRATSSSRSSSSTTSPRSTRARSAIRRARSTCCRPRSSATTRTRRPRTSSSASPRRPTAGRSCSTSTRNRVNELEREDRGAAADLWVKIGRWYARAPQPPRVRDPLGAAGAAHRPGAHRRARRHGRAAAQAR